MQEMKNKMMANRTDALNVSTVSAQSVTSFSYTCSSSASYLEYFISIL